MRGRCSVVIMARFTITLPESVAAKLAADEERRGTPRSTIIAQYLDEHYSQKPAADYEEALHEMQQQAALLEDEVQQLTKDNAARMQQAQKEAAEKATSQDIVIKGLQNELENAQKDVKSLNEKVAENAGTINELKTDKEYFKKQLELVTLRLPPSKVGFWSRIFGSKKEK